MIYTRRLLLLALLGAILRLSAQPSPAFIHYTTADGLPSNFEILAMTSDAEGFLWVGTNNGLARFDGRRFSPFNELNPSQPLPEKQVRMLFADSRGQLWVRLGKDGVYRIDLATYQVQFYQEYFWQAESEKMTTTAVEDHEGNLWFTAGKQICYWERATERFSAFPLIYEGAARRVRDICLGEPGELWAATERGLFRFDTKTRKYEHFETGNAKKFTRIARDREGLLWLSSWYNLEQGFTVFDSRQRKMLRGFAQQPGNPALPVNTDAWKIFPAGDTIWFATNSGGACAFDKKRDWFFSYLPDLGNPVSLSSAQVHCVYVDPKGNLWVATRDHLSQLPARRKATRLLTKKIGEANTLVDPTQYCVEALPDGLMALGTENGFSLFDTRTERFSNFKLPVYNGNNYNNIVISLANADAQTLWVGTWSGLHRVDKRSGRLVERYVTSPNAGDNHPPEILHRRVRAPNLLHLDRRGTLWILNVDKKLRRLRPGGSFEYLDTLLTNADSLDDWAIGIVEPDEQSLIFATGNGLVRYRQAEGDFQALGLNFPGEQGTILVRYLALAKNGDPELSGQALLAVANEKIWRIELKKKQARRIEVSFPTKGDFSIIEDDSGILWLGMENGLGRISLSNSGKVLYSQSYDSRNFLHDNAFYRDGYFYKTAAKDAAGNLYFSGRKGVTVLRPADWDFNDQAPEVKIISLKINNLQASLDTVIHNKISLELAYDQNNLTFQFAAPGAFMPALTRFAYRLESNGRWVDLGRENSLNFSRLAPGIYDFEVRASSSEGVWSEKTTQLKITVRKPWWGTWWASMLYTIAIAGILFWLYKNRLRQRLEHQEAMRLRELEAFKSRFITNITHEFRTPLTVIAGMAEEIGKQPATARQLILRNARNLLRLVNQMLDLSKLESGKLEVHWQQGDVVAYLQYLTEAFRSYAETKNIELIFDPSVKSLQMDYDAEKLQHVVANLLSNAIKFTPENGKILFQIASQSDGKKLIIKVKDTGIGIPLEHLPFVFDRFYQVDGSHIRKGEGTGIGLALTKELVELMGGKLSFESKEGMGSEFTVILPVHRWSGGNEQMANNGLPEAPVFSAYELNPEAFAPEGENGELPLLLLVEDNADVAMYIHSCLQGHFNILYAENGQLGIEKALETVPDIIISDVMMPEKDGFELTQFLKNDERTSHIPIILLTAKADVASKIAGLERGADDYLPKPFDKKELLIRLKMLVELRRKLQARYGYEDIRKLEIAGEQLPISNFLPDLEDVFIKKVNAAIEKHLSDAEFQVPHLCRAVGMSQPQLYRKIKALTNKSIAAYVRMVRLHRGKELLQTTQMNVSEVAYQVGFNDPLYFSRTFSEEFGVAPSELRK